MTDDDRQTASTIPSASVTSPDNKLSALSYTPGASMYPTPISANSGPAAPFSERGPKEYQRVPPLHDITRTDPEASHHGTTLPQINVLHPTRTNSPITQGQTATSSAQVAAQLALAHTPYSSNRSRTQKEEMLAGRHFYPFDKELVLERERCNAACWRFNNSMNPATGVSHSERARLFREILQPRDAVQISPSTASPVTNIGRLGDNVVVEAPFTCDYGYNISIGANVVVGRNCTIQDTCEVKIGDNCLIGPNVGIYTTSVPLDPKRRMGSKGPQIGKPITIEPDCFIGAGAMILSGRTIGKGSTVGAGAVVTKVSLLSVRCRTWGPNADPRKPGCASFYYSRRDPSKGAEGRLVLNARWPTLHTSVFLVTFLLSTTSYVTSSLDHPYFIDVLAQRYRFGQQAGCLAKFLVLGTGMRERLGHVRCYDDFFFLEKNKSGFTGSVAGFLVFEARCVAPGFCSLRGIIY